MPIPVPVTKTVISSPLWGIPLTNEHNRLVTHERSLIAWKVAAVNQTGITGAFVNVTSMAVSFVAIAGHLYQVEFGVNIAADVVNCRYVVRCNGLPMVDAAYLADDFGSQYTVGHFASRTVMVGRGVGGAFPPGNTTLQIQASVVGSGGNSKILTASYCVLYVHDYGTDPT